MKFAIIALAVLGASSSYATDVIYSPNYTCAQLKTEVATRGMVGIQEPFGFAIYASSAANCGGMSVGRGEVWGTSDARECNVGVSCQEIQSGDGSGGGM